MDAREIKFSFSHLQNELMGIYSIYLSRSNEDQTTFGKENVQHMPTIQAQLHALPLKHTVWPWAASRVEEANCKLCLLSQAEECGGWSGAKWEMRWKAGWGVGIRKTELTLMPQACFTST